MAIDGDVISEAGFQTLIYQFGEGSQARAEIDIRK
jgi:hypothetical protein